MLSISFVVICLSLYFIAGYRKDVMHPGVWTNLAFLAYAASGLYFVFFGFDRAFFLEEANISDDDVYQYLNISMIYVLISFIFCNIGFFSSDVIWRTRGVIREEGEIFPNIKHIIFAFIGGILVIVGGFSWIYISLQMAGGVVSLFRNVAAFRYLAEDSGVSTLPYHLAYAGIMMWMIAFLSRRNGKIIGLLFVPLGVIMILSTGRITQAGVFGLSSLLAYFVSKNGIVRLKSLILILFPFMTSLISYFFYRQFTSYRFSGKEDGFSISGSGNYVNYIYSVFDNILYNIFGKGNALDLQQISLILNGLDANLIEYKYGLTYFDWVFTLFDRNNVISVGIRVKEAFFPDMVGAPVPGMIGEAIMNFGYMFPVVLFIFCISSSCLYYVYLSSRSVLVKVLYCKFIVGFWAIFMKVDSSNVLVFLWSIVPLLIVYLFAVLMGSILYGKLWG